MLVEEEVMIDSYSPVVLVCFSSLTIIRVSVNYRNKEQQ